MQLIGLTGGIATGKSTVAALLAEQGIPVVDADKIAKDVVRKGSWGHRRVVREFGKEVMQPDGELDRKKLGKLVFDSPHLRSRLNKATHPLVILEIVKQLLWHWLMFRFVVIVDIPLLFEGGLDRFASKRVTVTASAEHQLQRLMARDSSNVADAKARISAQMPLAEKIARSELVINNDGDPEMLISHVERVGSALRSHQRIRGLLSSPLAFAIAGIWLLIIGHKYYSRGVYGPGAAARDPFGSH